MRPAPFEYFAPREVDEALDLLVRHGPEVRPLAGGQSLVPMMNMRLARPAALVDLNRVTALAGIAVEDGRLRLGAMARQRVLAGDPRVAAAAPLLAEAAPLIGHLQTRARGTIGGSLVHADPAAELPACALALDAVLRLSSARGTRTCRAADFFRGLLATALEGDELLVEIEIPAPPAGRTGQAIVEVARRHGDFALAGACAVVTLDAEGLCRRVRLVLFGAGDVPEPARAAEALVGARLTADRLAEAGRAAAAALDPREDLHATAAYRRRVAAGLATRALASAASRAEAAP